MFPVLFRIGDFAITSFGVMMALSFLIGGWILSNELRRKGENPELAWEMVWYAAIGGVVGARLYYLILTWQNTVADPWGALTSRGGLVWYGGFFGATALIVWDTLRAKIPLGKMADVVAPPLAFSYAIGRVGCFLVGDDWGRPTDLPWGIAFPRGTPPTTVASIERSFGITVDPALVEKYGNVIPVHPTQLYEIGMSLIIFAIVWRLRKRIVPEGALFSIYIALAGVERFIVEIFRAKDDRFVGPLTMAQVIALGIMTLGFVWMNARRLPGPGKPGIYASDPVPAAGSTTARRARQG